jgi:hypothetical protein
MWIFGLKIQKKKPPSSKTRYTLRAATACFYSFSGMGLKSQSKPWALRIPTEKRQELSINLLIRREANK